MATTAATVGRDRSVDLLRGVLVVLLVFVEWLPPGGFEWLRHSPWDGIRVADVVFPGYLFVVGASLSVGRDRSWVRSVRRLVLLLALGLVFNALTTTDPLRFTGVLQLIGVSGFLAGLVTRFASRVDDVVLVAGALLVTHGALLPHGWDLDRWLFADERLYRVGDAGHDPEGVLVMVLGGTALVLLGFAATRLRSWPFALGLLAVALLSWLAWEPNKRLWSPTFVLLLAGGFAVALLVLRPLRFGVLEHAGRNALGAYVAQHAIRELVEPTSDDPLLLAAAAAVAFTLAAAALSRVGIRLRV